MEIGGPCSHLLPKPYVVSQNIYSSFEKPFQNHMLRSNHFENDISQSKNFPWPSPQKVLRVEESGLGRGVKEGKRRHKAIVPCVPIFGSNPLIAFRDFPISIPSLFWGLFLYKFAFIKETCIENGMTAVFNSRTDEHPAYTVAPTQQPKAWMNPSSPPKKKRNNILLIFYFGILLIIEKTLQREFSARWFG